MSDKPECRLCKAGFPINLETGMHYGTQRLGMIPSTLCEKRTAAVAVPDASDKPEGFDEQIQQVFGMSIEDLQKTDTRQFCVAQHFYEAGIKRGMLKPPELDLIYSLVEEEGDMLSIWCANPDSEPNNRICCSGGWTHWEEKTFTGVSMLDVLNSAVDEKLMLLRKAAEELE